MGEIQKRVLHLQFSPLISVRMIQCLTVPWFSRWQAYNVWAREGKLAFVGKLCWLHQWGCNKLCWFHWWGCLENILLELSMFMQTCTYLLSLQENEFYLDKVGVCWPQLNTAAPQICVADILRLHTSYLYILVVAIFSEVILRSIC